MELHNGTGQQATLPTDGEVIKAAATNDLAHATCAKDLQFALAGRYEPLSPDAVSALYLDMDRDRSESLRLLSVLPGGLKVVGELLDGLANGDRESLESVIEVLEYSGQRELVAEGEAPVLDPEAIEDIRTTVESFADLNAESLIADEAQHPEEGPLSFLFSQLDRIRLSSDGYNRLSSVAQGWAATVKAALADLAAVAGTPDAQEGLAVAESSDHLADWLATHAPGEAKAQKAITVLAGIESEAGAGFRRVKDVAGSMARCAVSHRQSQETMVNHNLRLVASYAGSYKQLGVASQDDFFQDGSLGLYRAVEKFDFRRGLTFGTYATNWIHSFVQRGRDQLFHTVKLPKEVSSKLNQLRKAKLNLEAIHGETPTVEQLCEYTGRSREELEDLENINRPMVSMDAPLGDDSGSSSLADVLDLEDDRLVEDEVDNASLIAVIERNLKRLQPREAFVIRLHFGIGSDSGDGLSRKEIGEQLGISRERVRQIEERAFRNLLSGPDGERLREIAELY